MTAQAQKSTIVANIVETEAGNVLRLTFANGEVLEIAPSMLSSDVIAMATFHGLKQKLVDAAAISRNSDTGRPATTEEKFAAVKTVYDRLLAGEWNATREGGGNAGGLLLRALMALYPAKSAEQLKGWLDKKTDQEKTALRRDPKIAAEIDKLRTKPANVDTDELLGELED